MEIQELLFEAVLNKYFILLSLLKIMKIRDLMH